MKILHLISSFTTGGAERLLVDICNINDYSKNSLAVVIINNYVDNILLSELKNTAAEVIELKRKPGGAKLKYIFFIHNLIKFGKPQILHMHGDLGNFFGTFASIGMKNKTICTLHDTNLWRTSLKEKVTKNIAIKLIDKFLAISQAVKDDFLSDTSMKADKIEVIPNGIPLDKFKRKRQCCSVREIISVARLVHMKKGQDILIKAISILKKDGIECSCKLVGEGESRQCLEVLAKKYNIADNIIFLGNRSDVPGLLLNASIFVLPSRYEGFGIVIIEAMAAGIPVIASNVDGPKEIITHGRNGLLFESENDVDLAKKIKMIINDNNLRDRIVNNALVSAQKYSINNMHARYISAYTDIIGKFY